MNFRVNFHISNVYLIVEHVHLERSFLFASQHFVASIVYNSKGSRGHGMTRSNPLFASFGCFYLPKPKLFAIFECES